MVPARLDRAAPRGRIAKEVRFLNMDFAMDFEIILFGFYQFEFLAGFKCRWGRMATKFWDVLLPWPQHSVCWQVHPSLRRWLQGRPDQRLGWHTSHLGQDVVL